MDDDPRKHRLVILASPWLTLATLMIFRVSFARARVRTIHVVRAALYAGDGALWLALLVAAVLVVAGALGLASYRTNFWLRVSLHPPILAALVLLPWMTYRVGAACSRYLHVDRPYLVALSTQVILFLAAVTAALL